MTTTHLSDLLLATTVRAQQVVLDWADTARPQALSGGPVSSEITIKCDWVNQAREFQPKVENIIGNIWGLVVTYGGLAAILLAILLAVLAKFAVGRRLAGIFIWIALGLLLSGVVVEIVKSTVGVNCG